MTVIRKIDLRDLSGGEQPQEWTEDTVIEIIVDAFEFGGATTAAKLISERHNAALDAALAKVKVA
jgi:hypothetical protein